MHSISFFILFKSLGKLVSALLSISLDLSSPSLKIKYSIAGKSIPALIISFFAVLSSILLLPVVIMVLNFSFAFF